jgi:hypothetical protein
MTTIENQTQRTRSPDGQREWNGISWVPTPKPSHRKRNIWMIGATTALVTLVIVGLVAAGTGANNTQRTNQKSCAAIGGKVVNDAVFGAECQSTVASNGTTQICTNVGFNGDGSVNQSELKTAHQMGCFLPAVAATTTAPQTPVPAAPTPAAPTSTPANNPGISKAEFDQIHIGMTYDQVVAIVGGSGELMVDSTVAGITGQVYRWNCESFCFGVATVQFQNGRVITKAQSGL